MIRPILLSAVASGALLGAAGCRHKCCRSDVAGPRPYLPAGPTYIPPAGIPVGPGGSFLPPAAPGGAGLPQPDFGSLPPAAPSPAPSSSGRPAPEILLPDPVPGGPSSRSQYPATAAPAGVLGAPVKTPGPPLAATTTAVGGLPGFTKVKDGVASGRKPALDGFDALKRMGTRTVVYLHPAGADLAALRDVAEKRGLQVVGIETTPEKLATAAAAFDAVLADRSAGPVYVADDTGLRAGALWYVHFRVAEQQSDEVARIRARALGLTDAGDEGGAFAAAIRQYLAAR